MTYIPSFFHIFTDQRIILLVRHTSAASSSVTTMPSCRITSMQKESRAWQDLESTSLRHKPKVWLSPHSVKNKKIKINMPARGEAGPLHQHTNTTCDCAQLHKQGKSGNFSCDYFYQQKRSKIMDPLSFIIPFFFIKSFFLFQFSLHQTLRKRR